MSTTIPLLPNEVDTSKIVIQGLRSNPKNKQGAKWAPVQRKNDDGEEEEFFVQFPRMKLAFNGLSTDDQNGVKKYSISLSFDKSNFDDATDDNLNRIGRFQKVLSDMDEGNIEHGVARSEELFGKSKSKDVIEDTYSTLIKYSKSVNTSTGQPWAPTFKIKLPIRKGRPDFQLYNSKKQEISVGQKEDGEWDLESHILKGAEVKGIFKFSTMWVAGGKFGMTTELKQMIIFPQNKGFKGLAIRVTDDESEEEYEDDLDNSEGEASVSDQSSDTDES